MKTTNTINFTTRTVQSAPYPLPGTNGTFRTLPILNNTNLITEPSRDAVIRPNVKYSAEQVEDAIKITKHFYGNIANLCFSAHFIKIFENRNCQIIISKHSDKLDIMPPNPIFLRLKFYLNNIVDDYNKSNPTFNKMHLYINFNVETKFAFLIQGDGEENYNSNFNNKDFFIVAKGKQDNKQVAKLEDCTESNWSKLQKVTINKNTESKFKNAYILEDHRRTFIRDLIVCEENEFRAVMNVMFITSKDIKITKEKFHDKYGEEFEKNVISADVMLVGKHYSYESFRECFIRSMKDSPKLDILIAAAI